MTKDEARLLMAAAATSAAAWAFWRYLGKWAFDALGCLGVLGLFGENRRLHRQLKTTQQPAEQDAPWQDHPEAGGCLKRRRQGLP